jgi:hypothetical protein
MLLQTGSYGRKANDQALAFAPQMNNQITHALKAALKLSA